MSVTAVDYRRRFPERKCIECGNLFIAARSDARTCSARCRVAKHRSGKPANNSTVCHQRKIREAEAAKNPRLQDTALNYKVVSITREQAKKIILRYEWLGTVGTPLAQYGAIDPSGELVAVASFGWPQGTAAANICGKEFAKFTVVLQRGACAHWAHQHAASWFIPRAVKMAAKDHGWKIFIAYSDPDAGEVGTVYQACNWHYIGQAPERQSRGRPRDHWYFRKLGWRRDRWIGERVFFSKRGLTLDDLRERNPAGQWVRQCRAAKHKYAWVEAESRRERRALCHLLPTLPYPKRPARHPA